MPDLWTNRAKARSLTGKRLGYRFRCRVCKRVAVAGNSNAKYCSLTCSRKAQWKRTKARNHEMKGLFGNG